MDKKEALSMLKKFLNDKDCNYGYFDIKNNIIVNDNDKNNPLPDSAFDNWSLQSYNTILKYKLGVCYDFTLVVDKTLSEANIKHINLFLYGGGDQYTTHTTTIFTLDNNIWQWCDGSWHIYGSDDQKSRLFNNNKYDLIKQIKIMHEQEFNLDEEVFEITDYPSVGSSSQEFIDYILLTGKLIF